MRTPLQLITDLSHLRLAPVSPDMARCAEILREEIPFMSVDTPSRATHNGWIVPDSWHVEKATIHDVSGQLLYDGLAHPLGVCCYSDSFVAGIGGAELKKHLYFTDKYDDALVYHCDWYYKPHQANWGFSVPRAFYDSIGDRDAYHVELRTVKQPGVMQTLVHTAPGHSGHAFIFNAHNCHPSLCNDDLSGIAVGVDLMRRLPSQHRHTYHLVVMPEHFGTIFPLANPAFTPRRASGGVFIEALGTHGALALQRSFTGHSYIDRALHNVLSHGEHGPWRETAFRLVAGNDETCWEAPGIEIPFASLTRYPFREYHTSNDTPGLMDVERLEQSTQAILGAIDILENDCIMQRTCPDGLVCLSNPRYDLYQPYWDPSIPERNSLQKLGPQAERWNWLMNCFPRYLNQSTTCLQIAEKFNLPFQAVRTYIANWEAKGLLKTTPAPIDNTKPQEIPPW